MNIMIIMESFENGQFKQTRNQIKDFGIKRFIRAMIHSDEPSEIKLRMIEFSVIS